MYNHYRGRCIGRLLRFLWEYDKNADRLIFHGENVTPMITRYGKPYANYTWDGDSDTPTFEFLCEDKIWLLRVQENKKKDIIKFEKTAILWNAKQLRETIARGDSDV